MYLLLIYSHFPLFSTKKTLKTCPEDLTPHVRFLFPLVSSFVTDISVTAWPVVPQPVFVSVLLVLEIKHNILIRGFHKL